MKWQRFSLLAGLALLATLQTGCFGKLSGLVDVNVTVVDEKTLLERQILGAYENLEKDLVMVASVRSVDTEGRLVPLPDFPPGQRKALEALRVREFYRDDVEALKNEGVIGEGKEGYLVVLPTAPKIDAKRKALLDNVLAQENRARTSLIDRIVETNETLSPSDRGKVEKVFAQMNRDAAKDGEWVQAEDGTWSKKASS